MSRSRSEELREEEDLMSAMHVFGVKADRGQVVLGTCKCAFVSVDPQGISER